MADAARCIESRKAQPLPESHLLTVGDVHQSAVNLTGPRRACTEPCPPESLSFAGRPL